MDCREVFRILWPADALRLGDEEVAAALEHAADCEKCSAFLEEDRRIAEFVRESVPRVRAPRDLRERLFTALARERAGAAAAPLRGRRTRRSLAVATLVLAGLGVGVFGHWVAVRVQRPTSAAAAFAEDYLRRIVEQETLESSDPQQIAAFFARELGEAMSPPRLPDFELRRALICMLNGHRGGVVEYRSAGLHLSHYLVPLAENPLSQPADLDVRNFEDGMLPPAALANEQGLAVATWWDGRHQHALVGNLPAEKLRRLAPLFSCAPASL